MSHARGSAPPSGSLATQKLIAFKLIAFKLSKFKLSKFKLSALSFSEPAEVCDFSPLKVKICSAFHGSFPTSGRIDR